MLDLSWTLLSLVFKGSIVMNSRDFCFWLQGLFELSNPATLDAKQTDLIKRHLNMVFQHEIDPSFGDEKVQSALDKIHHDSDKEKQILLPSRDVLMRC